jgi:hypothetical protein
MSEPKVACRTPTPGKSGVTRIPAWKFDMLRGAILEVLAEGDTPFAELAERVAARLDPADMARLGAPGWHVTTVKLELETRCEIRRRAGSGPQVLTLGRGEG